MTPMTTRLCRPNSRAAIGPPEPLPGLRRGLSILVGLMLLSCLSPAQAQTCRARIINGQTVVICCDGNGVCYRK